MTAEGPARRAFGVWASVLAACVAAGAATLVGLAIGEGRTTAAALVYLLAVLAVALLGGLVPGIGASLLSFLGLNYFFTPPRRLLSVDKTDDLIALLAFLVVGIVVSTLAGSGVASRALALRREEETSSLYALSTRLGGEDLDGAFGELARDLVRLFELAACEIEVGGEGVELVPRAAATGDRPAVGPAVQLPLATARGDVGLIRIHPAGRGFDEQDRRVAVILARQAAAALSLSSLAMEAQAAREAAETGRVRRALLSAVSHDLRTPLASIKASITALQGSTMSKADADELLQTAREETERLERLVGNLLDLTRIRAGAIAPERVPIAVDDVIDDAVASLRDVLAGRELEVSVRPDAPMVSVDTVQAGQVIRNVLENAAKYAAAGSSIKITAIPWRGAVEVRVADRGPGIADEEREAVFEEFYQADSGRRGGTGLGLAVARAIARAHGGDIWIETTPGGGATVVIRLPAATEGVS